MKRTDAGPQNEYSHRLKLTTVIQVIRRAVGGYSSSQVSEGSFDYSQPGHTPRVYADLVFF